MAILQDLIVNVRNVRAELKVEPKVKVPIEIFAHEPAIRAMIEQNRGAVERLANVEKIVFVDGSLAKHAGARSTARFDVHVIYEKKDRRCRRARALEKRTGENRKRIRKQSAAVGQRTVPGESSGNSGRRIAQTRARVDRSAEKR